MREKRDKDKEVRVREPRHSTNVSKSSNNPNQRVMNAHTQVRKGGRGKTAWLFSSEFKTEVLKFNGKLAASSKLKMQRCELFSARGNWHS